MVLRTTAALREAARTRNARYRCRLGWLVDRRRRRLDAKVWFYQRATSTRPGAADPIFWGAVFMCFFEKLCVLSYVAFV